MTDPDRTEWVTRRENMYRDAAAHAGREAGIAATHETLKALGFTMDDIDEVQQDVAFLRKMRKGSETAGARIALGFIGFAWTVATAAATLFINRWLGN